MTSKLMPWIAGLAIAGAMVAAPASAGEHRIGFGYHHWETVDDLGFDDLEGIDDEGSSTVFSYQYLPGGLVRFEADVEYFADGYGGSVDKAYAPQFYVLVGRFFYAGVGIGATQSDGFPDGDDWSDPWYAARAGLDILLVPKLHLDLNANYRADAFSALEEAETDALTLGASLRIAF